MKMGTSIWRIFLSIQLKKLIRGSRSGRSYRQLIMVVLLVFIGFSFGKMSNIDVLPSQFSVNVTLTLLFFYLLFYFTMEIGPLMDSRQELEFVLAQPVPVDTWFKAKTALIWILGGAISVLIAIGYSLPFGRNGFTAFVSAYSTGLLSLSVVLVILSLMAKSKVRLEKAVEYSQLLLSVGIGLWILFSEKLSSFIASPHGRPGIFRYSPFNVLSKCVVEGEILSACFYCFGVIAVLFAVSAIFYRSISGSVEVDGGRQPARRKSAPMTVERPTLPSDPFRMLVLTHVLRDRWFRASFLPPAILYLIMAAQYATRPSETMNAPIMGIALFMGMVVVITLFYSSSFKASWLLQTAPIPRGRIIARTIEEGLFLILGSFLMLFLLVIGLFSPKELVTALYTAVVAFLLSLGIGYVYGLIVREVPFSLDFAADSSRRRILILGALPIVAVFSSLWYLAANGMPQLIPLIPFILLATDLALRSSLEKVL